MDVSALALSVSAGRTNSSISIALMSKVLDTAEATGEALNEMIESAVIPGLGENIDIRV